MAADGASLTAEQRLVLQAVYDHFREHASWPTFITIDRPIRREHGLDTAAIFLSLPDSLTVGPRPGGLRPIANDELRHRLPGIQACAGATCIPSASSGCSAGSPSRKLSTSRKLTIQQDAAGHGRRSRGAPGVRPSGPDRARAALCLAPT